ncbi:NAD(P)/FAD-dependent oxidoreductase [Aureimonas populi]|uniref:Thioredoxin reductase n=1 Tax=Aureimonas populi TaxID=1701758 RepID=A0ABW5CMU5_9HYPH|nr:NAD(P)/FAD-dependent oxidoreductase [Aureimonas populi]
MSESGRSEIDCLIVGGGPAGLTAALYLARFRRQTLLIDAGEPRAAWIPTSHNIPLFAEGISGREILARQTHSATEYGAQLRKGCVERLACEDGLFLASYRDGDGAARQVRARRVLLATGAEDIEPDLPDLPAAVRDGLVRYCPICDGYEARGKTVAVIGHGARGLGEAIFMARTYDARITLLTLGAGLDLTQEEASQAREHAITVVHEPIGSLDIDAKDRRITALRMAGSARLSFDHLYSALGTRFRSDLATAMGARQDEHGALLVGDHCRTSVKGLYAAGDVVRGLSQIVVGMGHAAVAATDIHNRCELPTQDEPEF